MDALLNSVSFRDALVLTGPTASGKTAVAARIAAECCAEVIALDSMTLYRGMDIGTAKPSLEERHITPYHLIDVLDPWENASVAWWLEQAEAAANAIRERGRRVLFVGGTALYLKALLCGIFEGPGAFLQVRNRLDAEAALPGGKEVLFERLRQVDPATALRLHVNDVRRVTRALEVWEATGRPMSSWQGQWQNQDAGLEAARPTVFWLDVPRPRLHERIDARVNLMLSRGWVAEADALRNLGRPLSTTAAQALGYRELFMLLEGVYSFEQAKERIQARTRQFAKRQITWFRHLPGVKSVTRQLTFPSWNLKLDIQA